MEARTTYGAKNSLSGDDRAAQAIAFRFVVTSPGGTEGGEMSNGSGLPKYISYKGHGATTFQAPVKFTGAFLAGFSLASDPHLVQDFVDTTLNQASPR